VRIVDRETFLAMPSDTLFSKYQPCVFEDLCIKGDTLTDSEGRSIDFYYQPLFDAVAADSSGHLFDALHRAEITGEGIAMDFECEMRDGLFDQDQLFAVWEAPDVAGLLARLSRCSATPPLSDR
jgi:hypothetical protein